MYERVLLATDGSHESKAAALELNKFLQEGLVKKVIILYVMQSLIENYDFSASPVHAVELDKASKDFGELIIKEVKELFTCDVEIETKCVFGDPSTTICEEAKNEQIDIIVMGSRGRNPVKGLLLGSVSTRMVHFAHCPVLIVKE